MRAEVRYGVGAWVACALVVWLSAAGGIQARGDHSKSKQIRSLGLVLKPHQSNGAVDFIDGTLTLSGPDVPQGATLVKMPLVVASIPTARYDGAALQATDAKGDLSLSQKDDAPTPYGIDREWLVSRATSGAVSVRFRALPRQVDANTRPGPLFDLRAEGGGLFGGGLTFLPLPSAKEKYRIRIHWDLAGLPPSFTAVSCYGDGAKDASILQAPGALGECYYAVGPLHTYPASGSRGRFGIYWLTDPPFDVAKLAGQIDRLYVYMSKFFHDDGDSYRIFIRKNPYNSGGGTALTRSFMFGWNAEHPPTADALEGLLAHEMTHNWPTLEGSDHGDISWYTEGAAEYYSILLSWRAGVIDAAEFLKRINGRAANYYQNPLQDLTNQQAEARYWNESNASYVPYGRGWIYLAKTDAEIREHSHGKRSLDDVVVALADRTRREQSHTPADWVELVSHELGPQAKASYDAMVAGVRVVPPPNTFGPCFKPETYQGRQNELGFDEAAVRGAQKTIRNLVAGSNAARAGLREGDEVIQRSLPNQDEPNREVTVTVRRSGAPVTIRFTPEGRSVEVYRWARVPGIADSDCRY